MVITLVMDQYGSITNGTTATATQFAQKMRERGHTVRIVTAVQGLKEENVFVLKERSFIFLKKVINSHGMKVAKPNKKIFEEAFKGADIVHFFLPFCIRTGKKVADKLRVPATAAFHVQPENITYNIGIKNWKFLNRIIYKSWKRSFNRFPHVHVPSDMIHDLLRSYGYTSKLHVISNGVNDMFYPQKSVRPKELEGKYVILMNGRLSHEKRQDLLIKAVAKSKYNEKIQIILCGKGPCERKIKDLGAKILKNPPIIRFCDQQSLINIINYSDLYVHTSEVELESIACMEAFVCGKVPVISDSQTSATKQFALHEENRFKSGDEDDLAKKIDWFIEHPEEKAAMELDYLELAKKCRLDACVQKLEEVFELAISESKKTKKESLSQQKTEEEFPMHVKTINVNEPDENGAEDAEEHINAFEQEVAEYAGS